MLPANVPIYWYNTLPFVFSTFTVRHAIVLPVLLMRLMRWCVSLVGLYLTTGVYAKLSCKSITT